MLDRSKQHVHTPNQTRPRVMCASVRGPFKQVNPCSTKVGCPLGPIQHPTLWYTKPQNIYNFTNVGSKFFTTFIHVQFFHGGKHNPTHIASKVLSIFYFDSKLTNHPLLKTQISQNSSTPFFTCSLHYFITQEKTQRREPTDHPLARVLDSNPTTNLSLTTNVSNIDTCTSN